MQRIHHRMPVILKPQAFGDWLDPENEDTELAKSLLDNAAVTDLVFRPVARQINSSRHNDASNIKPVQIEFDF